MARRPVNILITGTPGTGKSTLAAAVARRTNLNYINVGDLVKQKELHDGYNAEFDTYTLNDDKVRNEARFFATSSHDSGGCG